MTTGKHEDNVRNFVDKGLDSAREIIEEQAARLKDKVADISVEELPGEIKSFIKKNPWTSAALAAGLGFLVGYIAKSGNDN